MMNDKDRHWLVALYWLIDRFDQSYYRWGLSLVSDKIYDQLWQVLKHYTYNLSWPFVWKKHSNLNFLKTIKHRHLIWILSERTIFINEHKRLKGFLNKFSNYDVLVIEPKFDGISCILTYWRSKQSNDYILTSALTRGDSFIGESLLHLVNFFHNIPYKLYLPSFFLFNDTPVIIRGELMISKSIYKAWYSHFTSSRTALLSIFKTFSIWLHDLSNIIFWPFFISKINDTIPYHILKRIILCHYFWLKKVYTKKYHVINLKKINLKTIIEAYKLIDYSIDGIIIKVDDYALWNWLGEGNHYPRWSVAVKDEMKNYSSMIEWITYDISRFGILTPVAHIIPVRIDRRIIWKCSLFNYRFVWKHKIKIGDVINFTLSGGIVPKFIKVNWSSKRLFSMIKVCYFCQHKLYFKTSNCIYIKCMNDRCLKKNIKRLIYFCNINCIVGLSKSHINKIINALNWYFYNTIHHFNDTQLISLFFNRSIFRLGIQIFWYKTRCNLLYTIWNFYNTMRQDKLLEGLSIVDLGWERVQVLIKYNFNLFLCTYDLIYLKYDVRRLFMSWKYTWIYNKSKYKINQLLMLNMIQTIKWYWYILIDLLLKYLQNKTFNVYNFLYMLIYSSRIKK